MESSSSRKSPKFFEKDIEQFQHQQNEELLTSTFNNLYQSLNPTCPSNYTLPLNLQNLLKRILSTNFSIMKNDESKIIIKKRWGILYILNSFAKKNNLKEISFAGTNELQQNYLNIESNNTQKNNLIDRDFSLESNLKMQSSNKNYLNDFSPVSNINERFYENQNSLNYNNNINTLNKIKESLMVVNPNKTSLIITEKDLINDLLFVFEGINGKYIAYDAVKDAYILNKLIPWNEEIYNIVNSLSEIGWLYKKIKMYLDFYKESNIQSQFIKSFVNALQNELNNYFKLISFFRKLNSEQNINNNMLNNDKRSQNLNLKNIVLWTLVPKETLKWLAACCESIHSLKGTSVLSQIYSFVHYGGCNKYLNNILNEVSKPFILFVINWIKYGELQDFNKEFFVDIKIWRITGF